MDGSLAMKSVPLDYTVWSWESLPIVVIVLLYLLNII
jgi:hypothetical protein